MLSRKRLLGLWVGVGLAAVMGLTLMSGAASPAPDLGSPVDLDEASQVQPRQGLDSSATPDASSPLATATAATSPSAPPTPPPAPTKRPVVVASAPAPVRVPAIPEPAPPAPSGDDDEDDEDDDDADGEDDVGDD